MNRIGNKISRIKKIWVRNQFQRKEIPCSLISKTKLKNVTVINKYDKYVKKIKSHHRFDENIRCRICGHFPEIYLYASNNSAIFYEKISCKDRQNENDIEDIIT